MRVQGVCAPVCAAIVAVVAVLALPVALKSVSANMIAHYCGTAAGADDAAGSTFLLVIFS